MLLDYSKDEPIVVGKTLYRIRDNNLIGEIVFKSGDWGVEKIDDEYSEVSNRVGLRYVTLETGKVLLLYRATYLKIKAWLRLLF